MSFSKTITYKEYEEILKTEKIPYYSSWIDKDELQNVTNVVKSNWISEGKVTREFESRLAKFCNVKYTLATNNATGALIIALKGVKIVPQSEVYVVERFGKYTKTLKAGLNIIVPFLDDIASKISVLERQLPNFKISVITKDNVEVKLDRGSLFINIVNNEAIMVGPAEISFQGKIEIE